MLLIAHDLHTSLEKKGKRKILLEKEILSLLLEIKSLSKKMCNSEKD